MISNLRISVAELVVWALLAAAGLTWITLRALDGAAWLMDWLRDRREPFTDEDNGLCPCGKPMDHTEFCYDDLPPLPPERTWEQMTSHQLPVWWRETAAQIVDAQRWWYELPSGTGFTRAMAARVRELAP